MIRAHDVKRAGSWDERAALDSVVLDFEERYRRRALLTGEGGTKFLLSLPRATLLRDGDGLMLEDGAMVRVVGRAEPLIEIAAASAHELARLAWHLGNRHTDVQVIGERLRIRRDHVLEEMLARLGATLTAIEAPFEPERGAYEGHGHHNHGHDHEHDGHGHGT